MKKVFMAVALVATLGFALVSCDKDENKCWEVTYKTNALGEYHVYMWASQNNMDAEQERWEKLGYTDINVKSASTKYKNITDCEAANLGIK